VLNSLPELKLNIKMTKDGHVCEDNNNIDFKNSTGGVGLHFSPTGQRLVEGCE
jgi:hypothetical protein